MRIESGFSDFVDPDPYPDPDLAEMMNTDSDRSQSGPTTFDSILEE
jgi:hypothetical protein